MAPTEHLLDVTERLTRCWDKRDIEGAFGDVNYREALREHLVGYFKAFDSRWVITSHDHLAGKDAILVSGLIQKQMRMP